MCAKSFFLGLTDNITRSIANKRSFHASILKIADDLFYLSLNFRVGRMYIG
ncbi:Uncharacterised protein [Vibrio cholerae]|nr:Uncharacterised protein [Vibrio cholerae]